MDRQKTLELLLLILAGGVIYPIVYLRQNFQDQMLVTFNISIFQLGNLYSILGLSFFLGYVPGGWLADKISMKKLITFSLIGTGCIGFYFSTVPSFYSLCFVYLGWGITTGLSFSAASLKLINIIAGKNAQGKFFGAFEGGRGLVEAILATAAVYIYFITAKKTSDKDPQALINVILMYSTICIFVGIIFWFCFKQSPEIKKVERIVKGSLLENLRIIFRNRRFKYVVLIIFCAYQVFWSTFSFSGYLNESGFGLTTYMVGGIIALKLWTKPFGAMCAGIFADKFCILKTLLLIMISLFLLSILAIAIPMFFNNTWIIVAIVMLFGIVTYAARGTYWSTIEMCDFPKEILGLAIGVAAMLSFSPDILLPILNGYLLETYPGVLGYQLYFVYMAIVSLIGVYSCTAFYRLDKKAKIKAYAENLSDYQI
ncbi:MFS transporter [Francisella marina]|uniref:MFS transporter n=1 Tax=Francisella marina TaxID=2249302 RepID=A0ABX5ZIE9_9GAMM|nr:MFS transporter [Francisella marina]QEO57985.1 MFS transporter [Francisella marina]QEO59788.1 MFS transporter [Francisella marina]